MSQPERGVLPWESKTVAHLAILTLPGTVNQVTSCDSSKTNQLNIQLLNVYFKLLHKKTRNYDNYHLYRLSSVFYF